MKYPAEELARGLSNWASDRTESSGFKTGWKMGTGGSATRETLPHGLLKLGRPLTDR